MQTEAHVYEEEQPRWMRGYRCHGYWLGAQRLGRVTLPPRRKGQRLVYGCLLDSPVSDTRIAERLTLRSAKKVVEQAYQSHVFHSI